MEIIQTKQTEINRDDIIDCSNFLKKMYALKRRLWKEEQKMKSGFSQHFSMVRSPNRGLTPLKSAAKILISSFVPPSKIFVWEG
jgi:hypothetical protein